jgi:hypothetical protein
MSFKKNRYTVIHQAISKDLAMFVANYFSMKKQVYDTCIQTRYISPYEVLLGYYEGQNEQIPNTYSCYSDIAMETLIIKMSTSYGKSNRIKIISCIYLCKNL